MSTGQSEQSHVFVNKVSQCTLRHLITAAAAGIRSRALGHSSLIVFMTDKQLAIAMSSKKQIRFRKKLITWLPIHYSAAKLFRNT